MEYPAEYWHALRKLAKKFNWHGKARVVDFNRIRCGMYKGREVWLEVGFAEVEPEQQKMYVSIILESILTEKLTKKMETLLLKKVPSEDAENFELKEEAKKSQVFTISKDINCDIRKSSWENLDKEEVAKLMGWHKHILNIFDEAYRKLL